MNKRSALVRTVLAAIMLVFLLSGCSTIDSIFGRGVEEEVDAGELMIQGNEDLSKGRYKDAVDAFQKIKDRFPYSKHALSAELKMADALFLQEEYELAYTAYDEFEKLHPKNKDMAYVIYQKGMCNFNQIKSKDREQVHTLKAKEEFERLIKRFPRDEYANKARKNLRECLIYLAEYELYVANFYYKQGRYRAALGRYTFIINNYPDMGQYQIAMEGITRCKEQLAQETSPQGTWRSFWPFSIWK
ncbi:MAG TPA: outer membrane protein assembly factor BamD [Desulfatiglandales bacterium]